MPARSAVEVDSGGHRLPVAPARVCDIARFVLRRERVTSAMLSIAFVSRQRIAAMNRRHLGHRGATDVITFALGRPAPGMPLVGDVYIAPEVVRAQARRLAVSAREEMARVVVHGVLHAVGHAHPETDVRDQSPMWKRQEKLLTDAHSRGLW